MRSWRRKGFAGFMDLCSFVEILRSHFTSLQIIDRIKSVGYKNFLKISDLTGDAQYTKLIYALLWPSTKPGSD